MHCPNCGKEIKEGAKFCGGCGKKVQEEITVQETAPAENTAPVRDVKVKKKLPVGGKILIIVLAAIIVLGGIFAGLWFGTDLFKADVCLICESAAANGEEYCEDCMAEYSCEVCGDINEEVKDGLCLNCIKDGGFCKECKAAVEGGFYCADCINDLGASEKICFLCRNELSDEEIFLIDGDGYFYCENCDTGNYCISCGGVIDAGDDDKICKYCADYCCYNCGDVIGEEEIASRNENDEPLCKNCEGTDTQTSEYDGEICINCGIPVGEEGAYVDYEGEHWCNDCYVGNTNYSVNPGTVATCWFCGIDVDGRRVYRDSDRDFWCVKCAVENGEGMAY